MRALTSLNILFTVRDFSVLLSSNLSDVLLSLVRDTYEGKCYKMKYIHHITRILFRSNIQANQYDLGGSFNVNLIIEADAEWHIYQEAVFDMKVIKKTDNAVTLRKDNAIALLRVIDGVDAELGKEYPIKISKSTMDIGNKLIKINAIAYIPTPTETLFKLSTKAMPRPEELNALNLVIINLKNEIKRANSIDANEFDKTTTFLYPYKDQTAKLALGGSSTRDLLELVDNFVNGKTQDIGDVFLYSGDAASAETRKSGKIHVFKKTAQPTTVCSAVDGLIKICGYEAKWFKEMTDATEFRLIENKSIMDLYDNFKK